MISPSDPSLAQRHQELWRHISAQGIAPWVADQRRQPSLDNLIFLCKFSFYTGLLNKARIAQILRLQRPELKNLVRAWHEEYQKSGCSLC